MVATALRRSARETGAGIGWAGKSARWGVDFVHVVDGCCTALEITVGPPEKKLVRLKSAMDAVRADRGLVVHDRFDKPTEDPATGVVILGVHDLLLALEGRTGARWAW